MNSAQFDMVTRLFAARRSRRHALAVTGSGLAALGLTSVAAKGATPVASPVAGEGEGVPFMFVQTFGAGSLAPKPGEDGVLVLTADHLAGQTIYFSDRPERIVGMVATERFLGTGGSDEGLGFTPANPPNAALVLPDGEVLVVELIDPTYDPATGTVSYAVKVLEDIAQVDLQLEQEPLTVEEAPRDFEAASLFIDDCPDGAILCMDSNLNQVGQFPSAGSMGFCYDAGAACCVPCQTPPVNLSWAQSCNAQYPDDCNGSCEYRSDSQWSCYYGCCYTN